MESDRQQQPVSGKASLSRPVLVFCPWAHSNCYYTAKFCNALAAKVQVELLAPRNFLFELLAPDVGRVPWPYDASTRVGLVDLALAPFQAARLASIAKRSNARWLHMLWPHHAPVLAGPMLSQFRIAYTVHDPTLHQGESGFLRKIVQRRLVAMADLCFAHGQVNRRHLLQQSALEPERVINIPHGELGFWRDLPQVEQSNTVLFFGRIREYKGLDVLLEAFREVRQSMPELELLICGAGDLPQAAQAPRSIPGVRIVNRFVEHTEVPEFFLRALFVVLPYKEATQSGVVPMAFSLGRTCIASDVGAISEVVRHGENGLLVPPSDPARLADAMLTLARDKAKLRVLERNALETSRTELSWERTASLTADAYEKFA